MFFARNSVNGIVIIRRFIIKTHIVPRMAKYAVISGEKSCVVDSWDEAKKRTVGVPNSYCKKFSTETEAENYISSVVGKEGNGNTDRNEKDSSEKDVKKLRWKKKPEKKLEEVYDCEVDDDNGSVNNDDDGSDTDYTPTKKHKKKKHKKRSHDSVEKAIVEHSSRVQRGNHDANEERIVEEFLKKFAGHVEEIKHGFVLLRNSFAENKDLLSNHKVVEQFYEFSENTELQLYSLSNDVIKTLLNTTNNSSGSFLDKPLSRSEEDLRNLMGIEEQKSPTRKKRKLKKSPEKDTSTADNETDVVKNEPFVTDVSDSPALGMSQLQYDKGGLVVVYTDGACSHNGYAQAQAGIGVFFGFGHPWNLSEPVKGFPTNNNAEIQAATRAIVTARSKGITKMTIRTDSKFTINCMTQWMQKWKRNDWKLSTGGYVKNKEALMALDKEVESMDVVNWEHVEGHGTSVENEMADKLAKEGAKRYTTTQSYKRAR